LDRRQFTPLDSVAAVEDHRGGCHGALVLAAVRIEQSLQLIYPKETLRERPNKLQKVLVQNQPTVAAFFVAKGAPFHA
jgi:hypothetical protein